MKNLGFVLLFIFLVISASAQKKNGTVYIEHEAIDKTRTLWDSFITGDKEAYSDFFADSIRIVTNGNAKLVLKENVGDDIEWWKNEFNNLTVEDDKPAFPDAIEYDEGGLWVQDWLLMKGTHTKTGINLNLPVHNLYKFNDDGKIQILIHYFNDDIFDEIRNSQRTIENGKVYINHPYIIVVRKLANAFCAKDLDGMLEYYADNATFSNTTMDWGESIKLEERKKELMDMFENIETVELKQVGYPDCIYYEKNDNYVVYSWWIYSATLKEDNKKVVMPVMFSHSFNKDGKINWELAYYSSNHFD